MIKRLKGTDFKQSIKVFYYFALLSQQGPQKDV